MRSPKSPPSTSRQPRQCRAMIPTTTPYPSILTNCGTKLLDAFEPLWRLGAYDELVAALLADMPDDRIRGWHANFTWSAHAHQLPPERANSGDDWTTWLIIGGRGSGKTRAGAEWVRALALGDNKARIALIGETEHEARNVM